MHIDEGAKILGHILGRERMERRPLQSLGGRQRRLVHAPISLAVQKRLDFGIVLPELHDDFEVL